MSDQLFFKDVTLLITHYKRVASLERLLQRIHDLALNFEEVIVSDDGSGTEMVEKLLQLAKKYNFKLLTSPINKGLAHNLNKGQQEVKTLYTLYIQEDFLPEKKFTAVLPRSIALLRDDSQLDLIRFFANFNFPYTKSFDSDFDELFVPRFGIDYHKIYAYSDNPHLKRSSFSKKFGVFKENIPGDRTEYFMCLSFARNKGKAILYKEIHSLFTHTNLNEEPSTMHRDSLGQSKNLILSVMRSLYRQVRYNLDLLLQPKINS